MANKVELFFPHSCVIGLDPGKAVEIRAGEIFAVDAELVDGLKRRFGPGLVEATHAPKGTRRVTLEERKLDDAAAALASPPLDNRKLAAEEKERTDALLRAAQLRDLQKREEREAREAKPQDRR